MRALRCLTPFLALPLLLATGCLTPAERPAQLQAVARWQDQRLAPADSMRTFLAGKDAHVRLAAVRAAGLIARTDVVTEVLAALQDPSLTVAAEAAWALGLLGDAQALPALEQAAADSRPQVREAAVTALGQIPNDGTALLLAAAHIDPLTRARAWDGLRNQAARVQAAALREAIVSGLAQPAGDIRWRILRCAEVVSDTTLVPVIAPFAVSEHPQVAVHALRALGKQVTRPALVGALAGAEQVNRLRGRDQERVRIAACRALGALGPVCLAAGQDENPFADRIAAFLTTCAGQASPHVAQTALAAMAALVKDQPLPAEAAIQESLLPVWRIRQVRSAREQLASASVAVKAEALTALAALRGAGSAADLEATLALDAAAPVTAAALAAIAAYHPDPVPILVTHCGPVLTSPGRPDLALTPLVRAAALQGLNDVRRLRPGTVPSGGGNRITGLLLTAAGDADYVVAATAAGLLGTVPEPESLLALTTLWDRAAGPHQSDLRSGVLAGLSTLCAVAPGDTTATWKLAPDLRLEAQRVLRASFDAPDIRLRTEGRQAALDTRLLPADLIPTTGSLRATLPAVVRDARQPKVRAAYAAPRLRCLTDRGEFTISLDGDLAPNTCALLVALAERDYFSDMTFHRVVPDFVVQGGDPDGHGWGGPGFTIRCEWSRAQYERGTVGIAHSGKDTGGSQFFVTLSPQPHLNGRYTVIGRVSSGMAVVDRIEAGDSFRIEVVR